MYGVVCANPSLEWTKKDVFSSAIRHLRKSVPLPNWRGRKEFVSLQDFSLYQNSIKDSRDDERLFYWVHDCNKVLGLFIVGGVIITKLELGV